MVWALDGLGVEFCSIRRKEIVFLVFDQLRGALWMSFSLLARGPLVGSR